MLQIDLLVVAFVLLLSGTVGVMLSLGGVWLTKITNDGIDKLKALLAKGR